MKGPTAAIMLQQTVEGVERTLWLRPGYDMRSAPDGNNYGIHGAELLFVVKKGQVAVSWVIMNSWYLAAVRKELEKKNGLFSNRYDDGLGSIDYHCSTPQYEGQQTIEDCVYIGGPCYCDGSATASAELFDRMVAEGPGVVWETLEEWLKEHEGERK